MSAPRKRRHNHNEIEKKRRDEQRLRLEVLREHIPKIKMERSSAVAIITEATEYIKELTARVIQLEAFIAAAGLPYPSSPPQQYISVPAEPHTMTGDVLLSFIQTNNSFSNTLGISIGDGSPKVPKRKIPRLSSETDNFQSQSSNYVPLLPRIGSVSRRDSAMLLPTNDPNTFLFGKRDSIQNFFAGPLPMLFEDAPRTEISCCKCHLGVENLVMIDCDSCHCWYHIRCVGIDINQIPLQWSCAECFRNVENSPVVV